MNYVITMAGEGSRFVNAGYALPKMLIEAKGKTLLQWSIDSLPLELCTNLICVVLQKHITEFGLDKVIQELYKTKVPKITIVPLLEVTGGQAETVLKAKAAIDISKDLLVYNIDTAFVSTSIKSKLLDSSNHGVMGAFIGSGNKYSYAKLNNNAVVVETAEKIEISNNALNGMYHFRDTKRILEIIEESVSKKVKFNNEYYIAPLYNKLIQEGQQFVIDIAQHTYILGTPEELNNFLNEKK
jgi:dTDP-glucose pyrophosphorylase